MWNLSEQLSRKISFPELCKLTMRDFSQIRYRLFVKLSTEEGRKDEQGRRFEEEVEESGLI